MSLRICRLFKNEALARDILIKMGMSKEVVSDVVLAHSWLKTCLLNLSVSPEASSKNGDVEISDFIFGSSKMGLSPETSSKNGDVQGARELEVFSKMRLSPETSSKK